MIQRIKSPVSTHRHQHLVIIKLHGPFKAELSGNHNTKYITIPIFSDEIPVVSSLNFSMESTASLFLRNYLHGRMDLSWHGCNPTGPSFSQYIQNPHSMQLLLGSQKFETEDQRCSQDFKDGGQKIIQTH